MREISVGKVIEILNAEGVEVAEDKLDENLLELGLDSIKFIRIVVSLEEAFNCEIPDSKLILGEMDTVNKILNVLSEALQDWGI